jgi:hypothetical protein
MEYSPAAWLGALVGMILAVALYVPGIRMVERHMRAQSGPATLEQRAAFADRLSILRRLILGLDIAMFATLGYWIGKAIGAPSGAPPFH